MDNKKSFTLIEVLVVIFIIGLLATIIVVGTSYARQKARDAQRVSDLTAVAPALNKYYLDNNGVYYNPSVANDESRFNTLINDATNGLLAKGYLEKSIPNPNPTGFTANSYKYYLDTVPDPDVYYLYFDPEIIEATCLSCNGHGDIYLIKNGKVSNQW